MSKRKADDFEDDVEENIIEDGDARKYFKEGQRFVTPINGDSTRGFYESLLAEKPESHLAIRYCVENGLFAGEKHAALLNKYHDLKATGVFNHNRIALQRIAAKTREKVETSTPSKSRQMKREFTDDLSCPEKKHKKDKKDKKEKKDKKHKKEKKDKKKKDRH